jgi:hypothetical protein
MRIKGAFGLALSLGAAIVVAGAPSHAKGKAAKKGGEGSAPAASSSEVDKLRAVRLGDPKAGTFKWAMRPEEVMGLVKTAIEAKYEPRISQAKADPGKQQRIRDELVRESNAAKKSYTKFEGQKSGWDVSIIGNEFQQNTAEAVLVTKEDVWTRYFFFFEDGLYKMYLAFNKDALAGKSFQDFGKTMEAKYGHAREVFRDEKVRGGVKHVLDHYEWSAGGGDRLKLVDRSEFYGVYCLVLYDASVNSRVTERRKVVNPGEVKKDELVESVTVKETNTRDSNDDIIDRVTGKEVKKPGSDMPQDIKVPSPTASSGGGSAKTAASKKESATSSSSSSPEKEPVSNKKKGGKKSDNPMDGLEL